MLPAWQTERKTTAAGFYVLSPLAPGEYKVTVTASGFETVIQEHVLVDALATVALSMQLKIGSGTQQVTVTESPTMLHTDDATLGQTMENNVYTSLPLAMNGVPRDPTQFVALVAGVSGMTTQVAGPTTESFNGTRGANELYVEGIPLTFASQQADTRNIALGVSVEAVDQFQAETNGEKAMYSGQGMMNFCAQERHQPVPWLGVRISPQQRSWIRAASSRRTPPSSIRMSSAAPSADRSRKTRSSSSAHTPDTITRRPRLPS